MDPLLPIPEQLLGDFLRTHPALVEWFSTRPADPVTGVLPRASTKLSGTYPALRISRVGGVQLQSWQDFPELQIDCWADEQVEAAELVRLVVAVMADINGEHPTGWVRGFDWTLGPLWAPSEDGRLARYIVSVRPMLYALPA